MALLNPGQVASSLFPAYRDPTTLEGAQTGTGTNSSVVASATLSNTAAGYSTLGGQWKFAAVGAAETDYVLFGYAAPAGYRLWIDGINISAFITGAANAATLTTLEWSLGVNSTGVSLAVADSVGPPVTWAARRIALGAQSFAVTAAIGTTALDVVRYFSNPVRVDAGRFLQIILRIPVGTATASEIIRGDVFIDGYFEKSDPTT